MSQIANIPAVPLIVGLGLKFRRCGLMVWCQRCFTPFGEMVKSQKPI
ncbi:MAG: hypothetical protein HEQ27_04695 [Dolichospermum sp. JUN01]|nr:hypothetical protein [Dolichospermum sp. JUN01]